MSAPEAAEPLDALAPAAGFAEPEEAAAPASDESAGAGRAKLIAEAVAGMPDRVCRVCGVGGGCGVGRVGWGWARIGIEVTG